MAFIILFIGGFNMALPDFGWAAPVQLFHGVFIDNALLLIYLLLTITMGSYGKVLKTQETLGFAAFVALLGGVGIVSAGINGYALADVGQALRLFLLGAFVLVVAHWSRTRGEAFVLRSYVMGVAVGGLINIYVSITQPELLIGVMPALRSQNGAGGVLAIAVSLSAWLLLVGRTSGDTTVAIACALIGTVAAAMSFSKTSMTIVACGLVAWIVALIRTTAMRRRRLVAGGGLAVLLAAGAYSARSAETSEVTAAVILSVKTKFANLDVTDQYSMRARYLYFWGVAEIVAGHPLTGVSYRGFYDAITSTATYEAGGMADEDPESGRRGQSNPHNSFLYYAAANGLPGLVVSGLLFVMFLGYLRRSLDGSVVSGRILWGCFALAYFIYGMTLPTLFDTPVLYVPAAVAMAMSSRQRGSRVPHARVPFLEHPMEVVS